MIYKALQGIYLNFRLFLYQGVYTESFSQMIPSDILGGKREEGNLTVLRNNEGMRVNGRYNDLPVLCCHFHD